MFSECLGSFQMVSPVLCSAHKLWCMAGVISSVVCLPQAWPLEDIHLRRAPCPGLMEQVLWSFQVHSSTGPPECPSVLGSLLPGAAVPGRFLLVLGLFLYLGDSGPDWRQTRGCLRLTFSQGMLGTNHSETVMGQNSEQRQPLPCHLLTHMGDSSSAYTAGVSGGKRDEYGFKSHLTFESYNVPCLTTKKLLLFHFTEETIEQVLPVT